MLSVNAQDVVAFDILDGRQRTPKREGDGGFSIPSDTTVHLSGHRSVISRSCVDAHANLRVVDSLTQGGGCDYPLMGTSSPFRDNRILRGPLHVPDVNGETCQSRYFLTHPDIVAKYNPPFTTYKIRGCDGVGD